MNINVKRFYYSGLPVEDLIGSLKKIQKDYNTNHNLISYKVIKKEKKENDDSIKRRHYDFRKTVRLSGSNVPFLQVIKLSCFQLGYSLEIKDQTIIFRQQ
jgi:hypothetical protein